MANRQSPAPDMAVGHPDEQSTEAQLSRLWDLVRTQQAALQRQQAELDSVRAKLEHSIGDDSEAVGHPLPADASALSPTPTRDADSATRSGFRSRAVRRSLLKTAGVGAAALVGTAMLSVRDDLAGTTDQANAADGGPLNIGVTNNGTSTTILAPVASQNPIQLFKVDSSAVTTTDGTAAAIFCQGPSGTVGLFGTCNGTGGYGVYGTSDSGFGIFGRSVTGIDIATGPIGRIYQQKFTAAGAPTAGSFLAGEQIRDSLGDMYLCVTDSSTANPHGVWKKVASVASGFQGGAMHFLSAPIRILDTRPGSGAPIARSTPLTQGETFAVQVTLTAVGGVSVPAGAVALVGNITVVVPTGGGDLRVFPTGGALPNVSTINFDKGQVVANGVIAAMSADGNVSIHNDAPPTNVILDISGFVL